MHYADGTFGREMGGKVRDVIGIGGGRVMERTCYMTLSGAQFGPRQFDTCMFLDRSY